jgi:hypothetical protein
LLGADLPRNLMPPAQNNNEIGFWEPQSAWLLNDEIFESAGTRWDDWRPLDRNWLCSAALQNHKSRAREILDQDFPSSPLFVLKDPRICRLLPFWLEVIREFDSDPRCVLPVRNPLEVAMSLKGRDGLSAAESHLIWLRYVLDAEYGSRGLIRAFVSYDALLTDWRRAVEDVSVRLGIAWPRRSALTEAEIDTFLAPHHRHHAIADSLVFAHPDLASWIKEAYAALQLLQTDPESGASLSRLDKVRDEFDRASEAFGAILRASEASREKLESRLTTVQAERRQLLHRLDAIQTTATWQLARPLRGAESRWPRLVRGIAAIPKLAWWTLTLRLPQRLRLRKLANVILASGLFDREWYVQTNPDVVLCGSEPLLHWLLAGWNEGRDPNPLFNTDWYLRQNPDVHDSGMNPLQHYLAFGSRQGCNPSPGFDSAAYLETHPELRDAYITPLEHYLRQAKARPLNPDLPTAK